MLKTKITTVTQEIQISNLKTILNSLARLLKTDPSIICIISSTKKIIGLMTKFKLN